MKYFVQLYMLFTLVKATGSKFGYITVTGHEQLILTETDYLDDIPEKHVSKASFRNQIFENGWAFLEVVTNAAYTDDLQMRAAGYLEGYLCRELIWMHWRNVLQGCLWATASLTIRRSVCSFAPYTIKRYCVDKTDVCNLVESFLDKNELFVMRMVKAHQNKPYWYQVQLYYKQLEGLAAGYSDATADPDERLSFRDIFWLNMIGDLDELTFSLWLRVNQTKRSAEPTNEELVERFLATDHCTGLVKLLPDLSNLFIAHTTWNSYQSMLRLQKMYVLNVCESLSSSTRIPGYKMTLSSYPGIVQSLDDFYIISSGLVVAETTIGNSRRALYKKIKPDGQILEFIRVMVANRLARSGREWVQIFSRHNSGTYNNQWYILDYTKFTAATSDSEGRVSPGLLWVVEQLPGTTESADLTRQLLSTTYFPSYNMPYFKRIFALSGGEERVQAYGDWFGQDTNPRAKMLKALQADIHDMNDMLYVMRYNDFKHDPLSRCEQCRPPYSACNAVAARNDLNPANGTYPFRALGHRSHGATDAKLTSARLRGSHEFVAVSGPPYNRSRGIPPFAWSDFDLGPNISHVGHPDTWEFPPLLHHWMWGDA